MDGVPARRAAAGLAAATLAAALLAGCTHRDASPTPPAGGSGATRDPLDTQMNHYGGQTASPR